MSFEQAPCVQELRLAEGAPDQLEAGIGGELVALRHRNRYRERGVPREIDPDRVLRVEDQPLEGHGGFPPGRSWGQVLQGRHGDEIDRCEHFAQFPLPFGFSFQSVPVAEFVFQFSLIDHQLRDGVDALLS